MTVRLAVNGENRVVKANEMENGSIGQIVKWNNHNNYMGRIVQAYNNHVVPIGLSSGHGWSDKEYLPDDCLVRLLNPGELIEVVDN